MTNCKGWIVPELGDNMALAQKVKCYLFSRSSYNRVIKKYIYITINLRFKKKKTPLMN